MARHEDEAGELLWKYIEEIREADNPDAVNFVEHIPADLNEYAALLPVTDAIHETLREESAGIDGEDEPPAELLAAIQTSRQKETLAPRRLQSAFLLRWRPAVCGLAATVALALLVWISALRAPLPAVTLRVQSMIHDHEEFVQNPARVTVRGSDPTQVAAALSHQIGYAIMPVDLSLAGANLLGGRRCMLDRQVIAFFMYRANSVPVSVYELRAPRCCLPGLAEKVVAGRRYLCGTDGAYNVLAWRIGDRLFVIVSAANIDRLLDISLHVVGNTTTDGAGDTL